MVNPWEEISLSDYENHMSLGSVMQLQTLNSLMKDQFEAFPVATAAVLGVAGGNGLEHIDTDKYQTVYGIDINEQYLQKVYKRHKDKETVLRCLQLDLLNEADKLPLAELVIADLLIEYIGYEAFKNAVSRIGPKYVSCVIQINMDENEWVSDSPYIYAFDGLDEVHNQMEESKLDECMVSAGFKKLSSALNHLPNGKALLRTDYARS